MYVTAVLSGPGHLLYRTGRRRIGTWLAKLTSHIERSSLEDPGRIPYDRIKSIGVTVDLAIEADERRDVRRRALDPRPHRRPHPREPSRCG